MKESKSKTRQKNNFFFLKSLYLLTALITSLRDSSRWILKGSAIGANSTSGSIFLLTQILYLASRNKWATSLQRGFFTSPVKIVLNEYIFFTSCFLCFLKLTNYKKHIFSFPYFSGLYLSISKHQLENSIFVFFVVKNHFKIFDIVEYTLRFHVKRFFLEFQHFFGRKFLKYSKVFK